MLFFPLSAIIDGADPRPGNVYGALLSDAPSEGEAARVAALQTAFESGMRKSFRPDTSVSDVVALLKQLLRTTPEPLLTFDLYATFIAAVGSAGDDAAARLNNVHTCTLLLPERHAQLAAHICAFLHAVASGHPAPPEATRALAAAFAGLIVRDSAPTLEGVLSDAPYAISLTAVLIEHHATVFSSASTGDAAQFRSQMEQSFKRLRANMSTAYKAERAELRQKHSEREVSALMQRRADKVRTGTLDTSSLEAFERLAASMKTKAAAAPAALDASATAPAAATPAAAAAAPATSTSSMPKNVSLRTSRNQAAVAAAAAASTAQPANSDLLRSAASDGFHDDGDDYGDFADVLLSSEDEYDEGSYNDDSLEEDEDSSASETEDKPRRSRSNQPGSSAVVAKMAERARGLPKSRLADTREDMGALPKPPSDSSLSETASAAATASAAPAATTSSAAAATAAAVVAVPAVTASVDWSSEDRSEEVAVSLLDEKPSPPKPSATSAPAPSVRAPAPPSDATPTKKKASKEKRDKHKAAKSSRKSSRRDGEKRTKKKSDATGGARATESGPKRLGRHVRTIAALSTTAPGKLSYNVGEEAVIIEQLSSAWAKARIGDRTGLIKLADVEVIDKLGSIDGDAGAGGAPDALATPPPTKAATPAVAAAAPTAVSAFVASSPPMTRARSGSTAFEQQRAVAIEVYDAGKHEKAKREYLRRRARSSGIGIEDLAARGTNDAFLSTPLFFNAGDSILLLSAPDDRPFWQGELGGRIGHFLASAVRRTNGVDDDEPPPPPPPPDDDAPVTALASGGKASSDRRALLSKTVAGALPKSSAGPSPLRKKMLAQQQAVASAVGSSDDDSDDPPPPPTAVKSMFAPAPPSGGGPGARALVASGEGRAALYKSTPLASQSFQLSSTTAKEFGVRVPPSPVSASAPASATSSEDDDVRSCAAALLSAVERLIKALPEATLAAHASEMDALAVACRKTQQAIDGTPLARAVSPPPRAGSPGLSASTGRVPDEAMRKMGAVSVVQQASDDSVQRRGSTGGASLSATGRGSSSSKNPAIGSPTNVVHLPGGAAPVAPGSPSLAASPSRGRRSNTVVANNAAGAAGGVDMTSPSGKKSTRIGSFLSKFASNKAAGGPAKPTFGVPLRQLVESAVDIPEFVLRGGERLAKVALQEDVLLLADVDHEQVQQLRDVVESGERVDFAAFRAHDITALLQQFLLELPEPLISDMAAFARCQAIDDAEIRDALLQSLMAMSQPWRRALLEFLLVLQHRFERGFPTNTLDNFVTVFAPALWHAPAAPKLNEARSLLTFMCKRREVLFGGGAGEKLLDNDAGMPTLSAATIDRLILRLLDSNYAHVDPTFANVFFMCHDYFVPALDLAQRLIAMFERCAPSATQSLRQESWRVELMSRALLMLQFWLSSNAASHLLADTKLLTLLRTFAQPLVGNTALAAVFDEDTQHAIAYLAQLPATPAASAAAAADDLLCQRCRLAVGELKLATGKWTRPLCKLCAEAVREVLALKMQFLPAAHWHVFSAKDIADTITQIDFRQLRSIRPQEMLHKAFSDPKLSPNFAAMTASFNRYSQWVAGEVLKPSSPARRAAVIVLMLKIAQQLRRAYNFHAFFAFLSGLSFSSIARLAQTWQKVPKKYVQRFDEFQTTMSMDGNFGAYQRLVGDAAADGFTIIPLLVLLAKRLTAVEENNPTYLEDEAAAGGLRLVNCAKLRMLYRQVDEVMSNQSELGHDITSTEIPELRLFFHNLDPPSEETLHKRSLEVEARVKK